MESNSKNKTWKLQVFVFLAIAITVSLGFFIYQDSQIEIALAVDGEIINIVSDATSLEELLEKEDINLEKGTFVSLPLDTELENNMTVIIKKPKHYTLESGNVALDIKSIYTNLDDILAENGIVLGEKDFTYPSSGEELAQGTKIRIYRVTQVLESYDQAIPFDSIVNKNHNMDIGTSKTVQEGQEGLKSIQVKKELIDGQVFSTEIIGETIVAEAVSNIVEKGTKDIVVTSRGDTNYRSAVVMSSTAYDLSFESTGKNPGDPGYGITRSGTKARPGTVAVDPKVIPLGTKLYIQSLDGSVDYGFAIAEDTGGAIKGNKIDLFYEDTSIASRYGRKKVKVYILSDQK